MLLKRDDLLQVESFVIETCIGTRATGAGKQASCQGDSVS